MAYEYLLDLFEPDKLQFTKAICPWE